MSEPSTNDASLAERLHSFFHVELPADPDLAAEYRADPQGTLADKFADLPQDALDDAVYHFSQGTTASFASGSGTELGQFDGESALAYSLRASSDPAVDAHALAPALSPGQGFLDDGFTSDLNASLTEPGAEFGAGLSSYAEADPTFAEVDLSFDGLSAGPSTSGAEVTSYRFAETGAEPGTGSDQPADDDSGPDGWEGDLHDAADLDEAFDSGVDG